MRSRVVQTIVAAVFTGIAGCSVGPDYQRPGISLPDAFVEDGLREDALPLESMWAAFDDDTLTRLIERARTHNADVAIATASLNEARAVAGLQVFSLFPTVTLTAGSERTQQSTLDPFAFPGAGVAQRERAGFDASWEIDLFGTLRRASESIQRRVQARTYSVYATQLRVVAETAQAWFELLGNRNRLAVLQDSLAVQVENLTVLKRAYEAGRGTPLDLARARAEERRIAASVPGAAAAVTRSEQRLAVLTGLGVAELRDWVADDQRLPEMPIMQPVGNPAAWLARRPDVAAAEWQLAELTSVIGVRVADLYPRITLLGSLGWTARARADLGSSAAQRWQAVPTLDWRFLDFGRVRQDIREAEAQADGALANFEKTWRLAIEETENALAGFRSAGEAREALADALDEAQEALRLANIRYRNGAENYLAVLDAQRTALEFQDLLAQAATEHATALAALYKAVGGSVTQSP